MKRVATLLAFLLLAVVTCRSQTKLCFDSTAVRIDSLTTQAVIASSATGTTIVQNDIVVWRAASGKNYFSIPPESIQFTGPGEPIDGMSTSRIFDIISAGAVATSVSRGYTQCPGDCGLPYSTAVAAAGCVQRIGSGVSTRFIACTPIACSYREYNVCCGAGPGSPTITLFNKVCAVCPQSNPPCQATCQ
jgi:hypothetical protein